MKFKIKAISKGKKKTAGRGPEVEDDFEAYKDFKFDLVRFAIGSHNNRQDYFLDSEGVERLIKVLNKANHEESPGTIDPVDDSFIP